LSVPVPRGKKAASLVPTGARARPGLGPGPRTPLNRTTVPEDAHLVLLALALTLALLIPLSYLMGQSAGTALVAVVGWYAVWKLQGGQARKAQVSHSLELARADILPALREFEDWARRVQGYWQGRAVLDGLPEKSAKRLLAQALRSQPLRWLSALGDHGWLLPDLAAYFDGLRQRTKDSTAGVQAWLEANPGDAGADPGADPQQVAQRLFSLIAATQDIRTYVLERYVADLGRQPPLNADAARRLLALAEEGKTSSAASSARS